MPMQPDFVVVVPSPLKVIVGPPPAPTGPSGPSGSPSGALSGPSAPTTGPTPPCPSSWPVGPSTTMSSLAFGGALWPVGPVYGTPPTEVVLTVSADGEQTMSTPSQIGAYYWLEVNGLTQAQSFYSISGTTVSIPEAMLVQAQDTLSFKYFAVTS